MNNTSFESYLSDGCGRCDRFQTPQCKVHFWTEALVALRELVREAGLVEEMKWGSPCYTLEGKNVVMLTSLVDYCCLSFFKGAALTDGDGLLQAPGPNSRFIRQLRFTSLQEVTARRSQAAQFLRQAIALERAGTKVDTGDEPAPVAAELAQRLEADPELQQAFDALTPGRQRSHSLYVSGAKQPATRERRVEACAVKILAGKGFNER